jgi:hypothetical protein
MRSISPNAPTIRDAYRGECNEHAAVLRAVETLSKSVLRGESAGWWVRLAHVLLRRGQQDTASLALSRARKCAKTRELRARLDSMDSTLTREVEDSVNELEGKRRASQRPGSELIPLLP